ncbi:hypothetical protein [Cellulomonas palmilytica]|uniref:hypothetical protein n=1 Tax=Cellulomonas palmilytica TaxID=2608402 RepID=UPI001F4872AC|nr:hypothetical protein [Cellulomonas palmilytica]UJP38585.1 hypothetical protein F1D97_09060 [Cellulomonas palmilytica]
MSDPAADSRVPPERPRRASDVDVSPERIRALVASRIPLSLVADLTMPAPTAAQLLREEASGEAADP